MIYAGIGARKTPPDVLKLMSAIGLKMAQRGHHLHSGGAWGADAAFERGMMEGGGAASIFLPWDGFNGRKAGNGIYCLPSNEAFAAAQQFALNIHPAWGRLNEAAKLLHGRNAFQILGAELSMPVDAAILWTPDAQCVGGTATAITLALRHGVPVHNLADPAAKEKWERWVNEG